MLIRPSQPGGALTVRFKDVAERLSIRKESVAQEAFDQTNDLASRIVSRLGRRACPRSCRFMKIIKFSFKDEPIWMLVFSFAPAVLGLLVFLILWFWR